MKDLNLMLTITRRSDEKEFTNFFNKYEIRPSFLVRADGTTNSRTLSLWGIERTEKLLFLSVVSGERAQKTMNALRREMYLDLPDRGIAIACPLVSVGGQTALAALTQGDINEKDERTMTTKNELIVIIANSDSTDMVMDAAREGGAGGGTVLHAKGTAAKGSTFFGMSIAEEREILIIVASGEKRNDIIRSVMQKAGAGTAAGALAFSLPITYAAGFASLEQNEEETQA